MDHNDGDFLADKITYEETQNSGYTQIVPWYICHSEINSHFQYKYYGRTDWIEIKKRLQSKA